jgi:TfoX/Sxy family transcriptional regulator of competence genes
MASDQSFVDFLVDQVKGVGEITYKAMFGEFGIYADGKLIGLICDNKFYLKPTEAGRRFMTTVVEAPPYPGAKPSFLIEERIEDAAWLTELIKVSLPELPAPKPKTKNTKGKK